MKYYAGIGSRETPEDILDLMGSLASGLADKGYCLRSGGAPGADQAFEWGVWNSVNGEKLYANKLMQIFLPWPSFESKNRPPIKPALTEPGPGADVIAKVYHPRYDYLPFASKKLIARNSHQIFGPDVYNPTPSEFVICWTKGAKGGGGTGQALRIARDKNIPVYDLANHEDLFNLKIRLDGSFIV